MRSSTLQLAELQNMPFNMPIPTIEQPQFHKFKSHNEVDELNFEEDEQNE